MTPRLPLSWPPSPAPRAPGSTSTPTTSGSTPPIWPSTASTAGWCAINERSTHPSEPADRYFFVGKQADQRSGDLVIVPPLVPHQVLNLPPGMTMAIASNVLNVHSIELAAQSEKVAKQ